MAKPRETRSADNVWLIGFPDESLCGARLPSGRDVMQNFAHYHSKLKMTNNESASKVYDQLIPFWLKSRLPTRQKQHVIKKIADLFKERNDLLKHRSRGNRCDLEKQSQYVIKLDQLFDISHADSENLIKIDEDWQFLKQQKESRTGCIGSVDKNLADKEQRKQERVLRQASLKERETKTTARTLLCTEMTNTSDSDSDMSTTDTVMDKDEEYHVSTLNQHLKRQQVMPPTVLAVLDRTRTSIRKSSMIIASVVNEVGCSTSSAVLSKSTVHRHRQQFRETAAKKIKTEYSAVKCIVHWDGKLIPDVGGDETSLVDRLSILATSTTDGGIKLLGIPKLADGTGTAAANATLEQLHAWNSEDSVIGMCFDTTAANTGRKQGACTVLENRLGRNLLWLACRHHMFEVLLADVFKICFGPSTGPDILLFKRFREGWSRLNHHELKSGEVPLIVATENVKSFIHEHLNLEHPRDDYRELLTLSAVAVGIQTQRTRAMKPGAIHRARWMAKAIYSLKMEILFVANETVMKLTANELTAIRRFNRFVVLVYLQSWYTSRSVSDSPVNDIMLIQRLRAYDDDQVKITGIAMMQRHSWYLTPELATLALFSSHVSNDQKSALLESMQLERGQHVTKSIPQTISELRISRSFFENTGIDCSFLSDPVNDWADNPLFQTASQLINNLPCVNDSAERGVALIQEFNASVKDEQQRQFLLQVVEKHRKDFKTCNREELLRM